MTATAPRRHRPRATWPAVLHGWRPFVSAVLGNALIQALLVAPKATPTLDAMFVLLTAASLVSATAALAVIAAGASSAVHHERFRLRPAVVVASLVAIVVVAVGTAVWTPLGVALAVVAMFALPLVASGDTVLSRARALRRIPGETIGFVLADIALIGLAWLASFHLTFFVGGVFAAFAASVLIGCAVVLMLSGAASVAGRGEARARTHDPVG